MPIMSGFEVLERLTEIAPHLGHIPFVFLTALTDRDNELKGRQLGADDYVTKPIDFDVLTMIINARLGGVARTGGAGTMGSYPEIVAKPQYLRDRNALQRRRCGAAYPAPPS
jgi:DNA-binding response OmpR family regulator